MRQGRWIPALLLLITGLACSLPTNTGDDTIPELSLSSPSSGLLVGVNQPITISGTANDDMGIIGIYMEVDNNPPQQISASASFSYNLTLGTTGTYTLSIYAKDTADNNSEVAAVVVQVTNGLETPINAGDLLINEVGATYFGGYSTWFEIYNASGSTIDLSQVLVASSYSTKSGPYYIYYDKEYFGLPATNLANGAYILVRGKVSDHNFDGQGQVCVASGENVPFWNDRGFIELINLGQTVDFVRFGSTTQTPLSGSFTGNATALPNTSDAYGKSLARDVSHSDTDAAGDWVVRAWATPGGQNDITSDVDADADGIPDQAEQNGNTFAGMNLYAMGARTGRKDIFIHIDYMGTSKIGIVPHLEALQKVRQAFSTQGIGIHIDVGDLHSSSSPDTNLFDLDGTSHSVPYATYITLGDGFSGQENLYEYKAKYLDPVKKQVFHYCIFANAQDGGGSSGLGELDGNDFLVSMGDWGLSTNSSSDKNLLVNFQASTMMHELGHNLGLRHGGSSNTPEYKPNYYSIMNYLYQLNGLPIIGSVNEGDRYYYRSGFTNYAEYRSDLEDSPYTTSFRMDFSSGNAGDLVENSLTEANGLNFSSSAAVDWNGNEVLTDFLSRDINYDGQLSTLSDYDDWANINLFFMREPSGDNSGITLYPLPYKESVWIDPLINDQQEIIVEKLTKHTVHN